MGVQNHKLTESQAIGLMGNSQQWAVVLDAQDALTCIASMIETLGHNDAPVPHTVNAALRIIAKSLDDPLGIQNY